MYQEKENPVQIKESGKRSGKVLVQTGKMSAKSMQTINL